LERAEIPWVVAYLREDIQDLRNEVRENRRSIKRLRQDMDARIEGLDTKIDVLRQDMDAKIGARARELRQEIGDLQRTVSVQFRWMVTTMVAVGALIVATLKLWP
jgi:chromosome segregation ATPase